MSRSRFRVAFVLSLLIAFTATAEAQATGSKISPDLAAEPATSNLPVIVQYYNAPSSLETVVLGLLGGVVNLLLGTINAVVVTVPHTSLNALAADSNVRYISLDRTLFGVDRGEAAT